VYFSVAARRDLRDRRGCLEIYLARFDKILEDECDELVGPETGGARSEGCAYACRVHTVFLEFGLVFDDADLAGDFWRGLLELGDFALGFGHGGFGPEGAAARDGAPFAGHVVGFDVGANGGDVAKLEGGYFRSAVPEEGLAVTAVLYHCVSGSSDQSMMWHKTTVLENTVTELWDSPFQ
jgi:hypothetical protein